METSAVLTYVTCVLLVGLGGWVLRHSVDRRVHLNGSRPVTEELFTARLSGLEDRLSGRITALTVKLEDLETYSQHMDRRLEKLLDN